MRKEGSLFGGEVSGHYYFRDFYCTDSGTIPALLVLFFSSRRRHTRCLSDWSSDVCSSDLWLPTQTTVNAGPWYRIYDPFSDSYLYTFDPNEYTTRGAEGFVLQGISGLVMDGAATVGGISNMAWYRVYVNVTNS